MAKILVVDDSQELLDVFTLLFNKRGDKVETANSKAKLLYQLTAFIPDLILLDVRMNEGDGREICLEIKQQTLINTPAIILMSAAKNLLQNYEKWLADGAIEKPFEIDNLFDKIDEVLKLKLTE